MKLFYKIILKSFLKRIYIILILIPSLFNLNSYSQCTHSIDLTDTYGDGWNGGTVTVTVNGTPVLTNIALASGSGPATYTFTASPGNTINVTRTAAGSFPSEMRIRVYSGATTIIATQQPVASPGTNGTAACPAALPGENCANAQNLASLTSPYSATTVGYADDISVCRTGYSDRIFYINVPNGSTIDIWESTNGYDEYEYMGYGPACPGSTTINCWDNDGLAHNTWTNSTGSDQIVWYVQDAYSGSGTFTLNWTLSAPSGMIVPTSGNNSYNVCSGNLYDSGGSGGNYVNNSNGYTVLYPSTAGNYIQISGTSSGESCCDYVSVYNGVGTGGTLLGTYYMNSAIPSITSFDASGALTIKFYSDGSTVGAGFNIAINCTATPPPAIMTVPSSGNNSYTTCSGNLYDSGGSGSDYSNNSNGYTTLYPGVAGNVIQISGTSSGETCCDYIQVFNGPNTSSALMGTYYMGTAIPLLYSTDPTGALTILFISDGGIVGSGFNLTVSCLVAAPMTYVSSTTTQNTSNTWANATNQHIIGLQVVTTGFLTPIDISSFTFNTTGSTSPGVDIANAKLWSTGTSSTFATTYQLGNTVTTPNGSYTINSGLGMPHTLSSGTNYFWLTYDISSGAQAGNVVDAQCTAIDVGGAKTVRVPSVTSPVGNRPIIILPSCNWSVCLEDLYGDGWNGNYIEVYINGTLSTTYTLASGAGPECHNITINDGDDIYIEYVEAGSYGEENVYNIYDYNNNLYHEEPDPIWQGSYAPLNFAALNAICAGMGPCGNIPNNDWCSNPATLYHDGGTWSSTTYYTYTDDENDYLNIPSAEIFCGSIENNSWYQFVADATSVDFDFVSVTNCVWGDGIQAEVYEVTHDVNGCCNGFTSVSNCWNPSYWLDPIYPGTVTASGLTIGNTYILMVDGFAGDNCDFIVNGWSATNILPIELTDFSGKAINNSNILFWETASEINNDYFTLESSKDGKIFNTVTTVKGAGNSKLPLRYSYVDNNVSGGITYYRLKQTDFDGKSTNSRIISINRLYESIPKIYPNPASSYIEITLGSSFDNILIEIYNNIGEVSFMKRFNNIDSLFKLNLPELSNGVYLIKVSDEMGNIMLKDKLVINRK